MLYVNCYFKLFSQWIKNIRDRNIMKLHILTLFSCLIFLKTAYCIPRGDTGYVKWFLPIKFISEIQCLFQTEYGMCRACYLKWTFSIEAEGCVQFCYGGCHGNGNRFNTKEDCERTCARWIKKYQKRNMNSNRG